MKGLDSFTALPFTPGYATLVEEKDVEDLEKELLLYLGEVETKKTVGIAPLVRYLNEKMEFESGDDVKKTLYALIQGNKKRYQMIEMQFHEKYTALEKRMMLSEETAKSLESQVYYPKLQYVSDEEVEKERREREMIFEYEEADLPEFTIENK